MKKASLVSLYISFFKVGLFTFGGGLAMLPMFEKEICDKHKWATTEEIMDYYSISQMTPGVIAVNVSTFVGYKEKGIIGGIVATIGIISPSILIISIIASFLSNIDTNPIVQSMLKGLASGVCALLIPTLIRFGKSSIKDTFTATLSIIVFILIFFTSIPIIFIVLSFIFIAIITSIREMKN